MGGTEGYRLLIAPSKSQVDFSFENDRKGALQSFQRHLGLNNPRRAATDQSQARRRYIRPTGLSGSVNLLGDFQTISRRFAGAAIGNDLIGNLLTLIEATQPGAFNCANVDKYVRAARLGLNEAKTLLGIEPFYDTCLHVFPFRQNNDALAHHVRRYLSMFWIGGVGLEHSIG